jgi:predicted lipoprotein with Yx(FWY)xxD motif
MSLLRRTLPVLALLAAAGAGAAAHAAPAPTVQVGDTRYGRIIVDRGGRTLYLFTKERTRRSQCYGACARAWPPYLAHGRLRAIDGLRRSRLGTIRRRDGSRQVTYAGHPLYYYVAEHKAGEVLCQNVTEFGGDWLIVNPDGSANRSS